MKTIELKNQQQNFETGVKRLYFNASYEIECPVCKAKMVDDLRDNYLSYIVIGQHTTRYYDCKNCGSGYELNVKVKSMSIELEFDETNLEKL